MYVWIDLTMNKVIAFLPVVLASGVVLRERDTGVLPLLASKPLSIPRYFVLRALSACAVMVTLHVATQLAGAALLHGARPRLPPRPLPRRDVAPRLRGALRDRALRRDRRVGEAPRRLGADRVRHARGPRGPLAHRLLSARLARLTLANPITLGALGLGSLDQLGPAVLGPPMLALAALTALTIAVGAAGVRRMEA